MTEREKIESVISIVRKATFVVKVLPFVYVFLYAICITMFFFTSDEVQTILDTLFYVSPVQVVFCLILSRTFKLCKWHRRECWLPLVPQVFILMDTFYPLSEFGSKLNVATVCTLCILSLINAYYTFIKK